MRQAVAELVAMGPLPSSASPDVSALKRYQELITSIQGPVTDDEARALCRVFGPDDCFGLAWSVLHLIESAPGWPLSDCLADSGNEWVERLRARVVRATK